MGWKNLQAVNERRLRNTSKLPPFVYALRTDEMILRCTHFFWCRFPILRPWKAELGFDQLCSGVKEDGEYRKNKKKQKKNKT